MKMASNLRLRTNYGKNKKTTRHSKPQLKQNNTPYKSKPPEKHRKRKIPAITQLQQQEQLPDNTEQPQKITITLK